MSNNYDFYILSYAGGSYEESYAGDDVFVNREAAESAYTSKVAQADDDELYCIELVHAHVSEDGAIVRDIGPSIEYWPRFEEDEEDNS